MDEGTQKRAAEVAEQLREPKYAPTMRDVAVLLAAILDRMPTPHSQEEMRELLDQYRRLRPGGL